jgi:hypothetical protein
MEPHAYIQEPRRLTTWHRGPSLILDKEFSPPEDIPDYKDRIYSVAVGHIISEPIIAKLVDDDNNTITNTVDCCWRP